MTTGAFDFMPKPATREVVLFRVKRALAERRKADELIALRAAERPTNSGLVVASAPMRQVMAQVRSLAPSEETVLITGETGSGKEGAASPSGPTASSSISLAGS